MSAVLLLFPFSSSIVFLSIVAVIVIIVMNSDSDNVTSTQVVASASSPVKKTNLPVDSMLKKGTPPWNTQHIGNPERMTVKNGVLRLNYGKNAHGAGSGAKVSARPLGKFPAESIEFGYDVYFPDSFEWVKGGKLPGVCLGTTPNECATGGDWKRDEGSVRFMWRSKDNKSAYIIGYVYLPVEGDYKKSFVRQGTEYKRVTDPGNRTGHDMWHGELPIRKGWNSLRMKIGMNTPKKANGTIEVTVNGKTKRVSDVLFRDNDKVKISNVNFVSFFGGGSNDWNSPSRSTYTEYKNIYIA